MITLRKTFLGVWRQYRERHGQPFELVRIIPAVEATPDFENPCDMYEIRFPDGKVITAWGEEVVEGELLGVGGKTPAEFEAEMDLFIHPYLARLTVLKQGNKGASHDRNQDLDSR